MQQTCGVDRAENSQETIITQHKKLQMFDKNHKCALLTTCHTRLQNPTESATHFPWKPLKEKLSILGQGFGNQSIWNAPKMCSRPKKNTQPQQRFELCKPQKHKTPWAIYWTKERVAREPCYQKMQPRNHGIKTCNQKPCQQNMQSKTMPAKDAIKNCAIKISNHKTCHQKMQSKNMPSKNVIKKHAICGWVWKIPG